MKRIAIAGFQHETNTFGATRASFADFELADAWPGLLIGAEVLRQTAGVNLPIAGFCDAARSTDGYDLHPILWCSAEPCSYVTDDAFERIAGMICDGIRDAGAIDGLYLDLHGAMVTESHEDGEGELLTRIRGVTGPDLPIAVSLDLHANVTKTISAHASSLCIFRTYPHIDMAATGARAFALLERLFDNAALYKAFRQAPFLVPLSSQHTGSPPCRELYERLSQLDIEDLVTADIAMGFPAADIRDAGPSVVAYGSTQEAADRAVATLLDSLLAAEGRFDDPLLSAEAAVARAMAHDGSGPVVIADAQDNPGAGATSDTTGLLTALVAGKARGAVLALLDDPEVAASAHAAGIGAELETALGGKSGQAGQMPYKGRFRVEALSDGRFPFTGVMYAGNTADLGPTVLLRVVDADADVRVVVGSRRCQCLDQAIFSHIGIELPAQRIVAVKSTVHFRADFEPVADLILLAEAPGAHPCRLDRVTYRNLRPGVRLGPRGRPFGVRPLPKAPV